MTVKITATLTFDLSPESVMMDRAWANIVKEDRLNEQIQSLILVEPWFGLTLETVEDAEIVKVEL